MKLVLPLTLCALAAITRPEARPPRHPGASCSCISCCPTGFRLHDEAVRRPASMPNFHPGRHRLPASCAGSPGSSARLHCWFGSSPNARRESHSRSGFPQFHPQPSSLPPAASWPLVIVIRCTPLGSKCTPHRPFVKWYGGAKRKRLCSDRFRIAVEPVIVKRFRKTLVNRGFCKRKLDTRFDTHCIKTGVQLWCARRDLNPHVRNAH